MRRRNMALGIGGCILTASLLLIGCGAEGASQSEASHISQEIGQNGEGASDNGEAAQATVEQEESEDNQTDTAELEDELMEQYTKSVKATAFYKTPGNTNPIISQKFGADPYAMVYEDRVYFYMTADAFEYDAKGEVLENSYSKIRSINVVSTDDMVNFTDHGAIQVAGKTGAAKWANNSWAPAAAWKMIDGKPKFFLYFANNGSGIGVLTADSPTGPWTDPIGHELITRQTPNCANVLWLFDPAVLVDDDGKAYMYFGGGIPDGKFENPGTGRVIQLGDDMISTVGEAKVIDAPYIFEDSGIHKFNNKYYYTYCSNWNVSAEGTTKYGFNNAEIVCMESDSPMGPFTLKETILENPGRVFGLYGNNHHCVFEFQDRWYITYHARSLEKAMKIEKGYRSTHIDQFTMQEDGTIGKIRMTSKGREQLKYVDAFAQNKAVNVAMMAGTCAVPADAEAARTSCGNMALGDIQTGDYVEIQGVDFGTGASKLVMRIKNKSGIQGGIQVRLDRLFGDVIAYVTLEEKVDSDYVEYTAELFGAAEGVHNLYFIAAQGEDYEILDWHFEQ